MEKAPALHKKRRECAPPLLQQQRSRCLEANNPNALGREAYDSNARGAGPGLGERNGELSGRP